MTLKSISVFFTASSVVMDKSIAFVMKMFWAFISLIEIMRYFLKDRKSKKMLIQYLQHVPFEGLGGIEAWAKANCHQTKAIEIYAGETFPLVKDFDCLIALGGPMNVCEESAFPFLKDEKRFIERAINADKIVLGICLGAQLIADVLGAKVVKNEHEEIGWFPVELTSEAADAKVFSALPQVFTTFHWHGEMFEIPRGARRVAESAACPNQAFVYGENVCGAQFHPEVTKESLRLMLQHESEDFKEGAFIQTADEMLNTENHFAENTALLNGLLAALIQ